MEIFVLSLYLRIAKEVGNYWIKFKKCKIHYNFNIKKLKTAKICICHQSYLNHL